MKRREGRRRRSWLARVRIPPWLFYLLVGLFAILSLGLMGWALLHPTGAP